MSTPSTLAREHQDPNRDKSDTNGDVLQRSSDDVSFTIPIPKEVQHSISTILSTLDQLCPLERHHLILIVTVVCVETAFLKWIRRSNEDVLSTIFFTILLGSFAWPVWSNLKGVHSRLDDVSAKIEVLQQAINTPKPTTVIHPPIEYVPVPAVPKGPASLPREAPSVPPASSGDGHGGVVLEGMFSNIVEEPNVRTAGHSNEQSAPPTKPNIVGGFADVCTTGHSAEQPAPPTETGSSSWLPALREIKQRIQQFTNGRIERISHLDQSEPSILLSVRRWAMRLLMSAASLSPANFAPPVGYLGPIESMPYYPTGDIRGDRGVAFTIAMDCLDDLEADLNGNDVGFATKLFKLAQALSDLGLRDYALNTSGYALDTLERLYVTEPNQSRLHVASVLSLRANILCDLKRNDEARDAADRAVTLCREHQDSQTGPVPELAYSLLNYAVVLDSLDLKDESAAVAFELCADDSQSDTKDITALCKLCLSNPRIGSDDDMDLSMADETIGSTHSSSDANSQMILAGALLNKSKILSSRGQNDTACSFSAEAVTIFRTMAAGRPVFSLFLAHALDTHAHHLSEANRKGESYSIRQDAIEHWQTLKISAGGAVARPLAWSTFELAKFRHKDGEKNALREELRIAESAVGVFREVEPLDAPGLGDALYLVANRMLELDNNRDAATYAEESVQHFRDAFSEDQKYANDLVMSLSLASSCLACTERADDAYEYAKQAVEVQHGRKDVDAEDQEYKGLLSKLLMDVVTRAAEIDRHAEALPWFQELQALGILGGPDNPLLGLGGMSQGNVAGPSYTRNLNTNGPSFGSSSGSTLSVDKGKGVAVPSIGVGSPAARGTGRLADEEIFSPGASGQRRPGGLGNTGPGGGQGDLLSGLLGGRGMGGPGGSDLLSGLLGGMGGGRGMGGPGMGGPGGNDPLSGLLGGRGMGGPGGSDMLSGLLGGMGGGRGMGGPGPGGNDPLSGLLGGMGGGRGMGMMSGGRTLGGSGIPGGPGMMGGLGGARSPGSPGGRLGAGRLGGMGMGGLGGFDDLGSSINGLTENLLDNLNKLGPDFVKDDDGSNAKDGKTDNPNGDSGAQGESDSQSSPTTRTGTWSGTGIQSNLNEDST